jgi:hypothetical protein
MSKNKFISKVVKTNANQLKQTNWTLNWLKTQMLKRNGPKHNMLESLFINLEGLRWARV